MGFRHVVQLRCAARRTLCAEPNLPRRIVRRMASTRRQPAERHQALTIERRRQGRGFGYYRNGRRDPRPADRRAAGQAGRAAGLCRCGLCGESVRAVAGDGPRRRRPLAIPLPSRSGEGSRAPQAPASRSPDRGADAHPPRRQRRDGDAKAEPRIRHGHGDCADRCDRHPRRHVAACTAVRAPAAR